MPELELRAVGFSIKQARLNLPITSPIYDLQFLNEGWDDPQTPPLSIKTLMSAEHLWRDVRLKNDIAGVPSIEPGPGGFVEFSWLSNNPDKRLILWVYGDSKFCVEFTLEANGTEVSSGDVGSLHEAVALVDQYAAL